MQLLLRSLAPPYTGDLERSKDVKSRAPGLAVMAVARALRNAVFLYSTVCLQIETILTSSWN